MKPVYVIIVFLLIGTVLFSQNKNEVYTAEMYYNEAEGHWENAENDYEEPINIQSVKPKRNSNKIDSNEIEYSNIFNLKRKDKDVRLAHIPNTLYFPEGFSMKIQKDKYSIIREKGKYTFYIKETPGETADFEVFVTDFDLQNSLVDNGYFCISKNKNLGLYAVYTVNPKNDKRVIHGFRLFYTLPINNNQYVTVRSDLFKNHRQSEQYINDVVNLNYGDTFYGSLINK